MLIVEELYLLLTNESGKQERPGTPRAYGAVAALITDLVIAERVSLTDEKRPRVNVISEARTGKPVLDAALPLLAQRSGTRLESLVTWGKLDPENEVVDSLVRAGVLAVGEPTMLGFGRPRTPEVNPAPEAGIRSRLANALSGAARPSVADMTLLAILQGLGVAHHVLSEESGGMRGRDLKRRIAELVDGSPAGTAVERAVQAINAAMMTAVFVATTASTTS